MASPWIRNANNIPPYIPLFWADWENDPHVKQMNETMQGVYFLIIKELWKCGSFEFNPVQLAEDIKAKDVRNVKNFLTKWGHLFRCVECDGVPVPRWGHAGVTQGSRLTHVEVTPWPCKYCVEVTPCSCCDHAVFAYQVKARNLRNDVTSGFGLGTNNITPKLHKTKLRGNKQPKGVKSGCEEVNTSTPFEVGESSVPFTLDGDEDE